MNRKDAIAVFIFWTVYTAAIAAMFVAAFSGGILPIIGGLFFVVVFSGLITALTVGNQNKDRDE